MPKRTTSLTDANARLHKNHSYELLVATWLMQGGWQVFTPLLDAAHAVDLIASDGPKSYRLQIKSVESQDETSSVLNCWKDRHIDYVIYFAQRSNWGYVCPAFTTNRKRLDDASHKRFQQNCKEFLAAFHTCEQPGLGQPIARSSLFEKPSAPLLRRGI
jgi:hypothetical protein